MYLVCSQGDGAQGPRARRIARRAAQLRGPQDSLTLSPSPAIRDQWPTNAIALSNVLRQLCTFQMSGSQGSVCLCGWQWTTDMALSVGEALYTLQHIRYVCHRHS